MNNAIKYFISAILIIVIALAICGAYSGIGYLALNYTPLGVVGDQSRFNLIELIIATTFAGFISTILGVAVIAVAFNVIRSFINTVISMKRYLFD